MAVNFNKKSVVKKAEPKKPEPVDTKQVEENVKKPEPKEVLKKPITKVVEKPEETHEEEELLLQLASEINKGSKTSTVTIGSEGGDANVPYWVLTGIPQLDYIIGGSNHPGVPGGRITEIYGGEATGKSTLAVWLTHCAMEQKKAIAYYQDVERVLTPEIIKGTGINMNRVLLGQPDTIEEVFDEQEAVVKTLATKFPDKPVVITLDSVAACSTQAEIDGDMGDIQMGSLARGMSKGMRKIKEPIFSSGILSLWVNQVRDKMNVTWGETTSTSGGRALAFFASVRIQLAKVATLKDSKGTPYGCTIEATIKKNKVAPPLKKARYDILFVEDKTGSYPKIDTTGAVLDWLKEHNLIEGSVGRYEIEGKSMFKKDAVKLLNSDKDLLDKYTKLAYSV